MIAARRFLPDLLACLAPRYRAWPAPVRVGFYLLGAAIASLIWGAVLWAALRPGPDVLVRPERYPLAFNAYLAGSYVGLVGGALGLWRWGEGQPLSALGIGGGWRRGAAQMLEGSLWGLGSIGALFATALWAGWLLWDATAWRATPAGLWAPTAASALFFGLSEELLFRGFVLHTLRRGLRPAVAVAASAVLYAMVHFLRADLHWVQVVGPLSGLWLAGCLLGWLALETRTIWLGVGLHAAWVDVFLLSDRQKWLVYPLAHNWLTGGGYPLGGALGLAMLAALALTLALRFGLNRRPPANAIGSAGDLTES